MSEHGAIVEMSLFDPDARTHGLLGYAVVHLPRATIEAEAKRGIDLFAVARNNGVELRVLEDNIIPVEGEKP